MDAQRAGLRRSERQPLHTWRARRVSTRPVSASGRCEAHLGHAAKARACVQRREDADRQLNVQLVEGPAERQAAADACSNRLRAARRLALRASLRQRTFCLQARRQRLQARCARKTGASRASQHKRPDAARAARAPRAERELQQRTSEALARMSLRTVPPRRVVATASFGSASSCAAAPAPRAERRPPSPGAAGALPFSAALARGGMAAGARCRRAAAANTPLERRRE
jgi:hypothetical protein